MAACSCSGQGGDDAAIRWWTTYVLVSMGRYDILHEIERLDPERDNQRIVHLSFGYDFPWDSVRSLEIALYRTYCVPSISKLLDRTREFYEHTQRRYDDTSIIVAEMCEWGYESGSREGSARPDELGARPLQDRERRLPLRAVDVHLRAGSMDRRRRLAPHVRERAHSPTITSGVRSGRAWGSSTSRAPTRRSRRGPATTSALSSASRTRTSALGRQPATCSHPGFRAC